MYKFILFFVSMDKEANSSISMAKSKQEMRREACLFGMLGKPVNKYQQRLNDVAGDLCVKNSLLLRNKGKLLELARKQVHESGYVYAKGKSHSKILNPSTKSQPSREKVDKQESIAYKVFLSKLETQRSTLSSNRREWSKHNLFRTSSSVTR